MMDNLRDVYKTEVYELLSELETSLLELEERVDDQELIGRIFRALHTIKGSGAMFGFDDIAEFTHEMETVFDLVRDGRITVTKELVDLALLAGDHIREMLDAFDGGGELNGVRGREIIESLGKILPRTEDNKEEREGEASPEFQREEITCRIRFRPDSDIFSTGTNPILLINELRGLGECQVIAHRNGIPRLRDMNPETCYTYWDVILNTSKGIDAVKDVFIFVEDDCELKIDVIDGSQNLDEEDYKRLGEILIERGDLAQEDLQKVLGDQKRVGEMLVGAGLIDSEKVESALVEQEHVRGIRKKRQATESSFTIRVPADKLDSLVDLVGELVTVQARLSQTTSEKSDPLLTSISEEVERLTGELRDNTMSIRMLPIGITFSKFRRMVRDLSHDLGKEVEMVTDGAETELDKSVIEQLNDPLVHLIRNSIDHGIEYPEAREAMGKPRVGRVHLSAAHSGANVLIRIKDDGAGLDKEAIRTKAVDKGLIAPDAELSEKEMFNLIFAPGFSTSKDITNLSGRGVGMDVVKRSIDALRGSVDIKSQRGTGTTIALKLPLTLAIIEGLLIKIGQEYFALPLSVVEECVELTREDVARAHGRRIAHVREEIVPYIHLRDWFMMDGDSPDIEQIVITRVDGFKVGFVVDHVLGEHQTVIKTLGRVYRDVEGISGATILGNGTVALILDVPQLLQSVGQKEVHEMR